MCSWTLSAVAKAAWGICSEARHAQKAVAHPILATVVGVVQEALYYHAVQYYQTIVRVVEQEPTNST